MSIVLPNKKNLSDRVKAYRNNGYNIVTFGSDRVEMENRDGDFVVLETRKSFENNPSRQTVKKPATARELYNSFVRAYNAREDYERSLTPGPLTKDVIDKRRELSTNIRQAINAFAEKTKTTPEHADIVLTESMSSDPGLYRVWGIEVDNLIRETDEPKKYNLAQRVDDIVYKINPDDYNKSFKNRAEGLKVAEDALKTPEGRKAVIEELESYLRPGDDDNNAILEVRNRVMDLQYKNTPRPPKIGYKMPTQSQLNRGFRR